MLCYLLAAAQVDDGTDAVAVEELPLIVVEERQAVRSHKAVPGSLVCRLLDIPVLDCLSAGANQRCVRFLAERMDAIDPEMSTVPPELDFRVKCSGMQENTVRRSCGRQILWLILDVTTMNLHMRSIALR